MACGGAGQDLLYGGSEDILRYDLEETYRTAAKATGVSVDLEDGSAQDTYGDTDTLFDFQNVVGTSNADLLLGNDTSTACTARVAMICLMGVVAMTS